MKILCFVLPEKCNWSSLSSCVMTGTVAEYTAYVNIIENYNSSSSDRVVIRFDTNFNSGLISNSVGKIQTKIYVCKMVNNSDNENLIFAN